MQAGATMLGRRRLRHELRTLTYVTLDNANGGVVRNLTHDGITVQAVTAPRPRQQMRVRFELRYPRLRVDTRGEIVWANFSGLCGIRFLDLPAQTARQIDEWIFGNLLEGYTLASERGIIFPIQRAAAWPETATPPANRVNREVSAISARRGHVQVIDSVGQNTFQPEAASMPAVPLDWLSQPLSGRSLAWVVNTLVVSVASLLFALIFLSVAGEAPEWPLAMAFGATISMASLYWVFFRMFGGMSFGARLARLAGAEQEQETLETDRFR
jgi:hypothetical protein